MKSTSGEHYAAIDHLRAFAIFLVFTWHFTHSTDGYPVPFEFVPIFFPFALLDEGQTGVALFMALSGYLFAKLLDGKQIIYTAFFWNRALRLLPLLAIVILIDATRRVVGGERVLDYVLWLMRPALPNGGWSIAVEIQFYLLLPMLLWMFRNSKFLPLTIVAAAVLLRSYLHYRYGEVQRLAYWTILGRIDQFVFGMVAFHSRSLVCNRHAPISIGVLVFLLFYWLFDYLGGFYNYPSYPSPKGLWIFLPTIEAIAYACIIAWYDNSFHRSNSAVSRFIGRMGEYSYSIYLLHFFFVFAAAKFVHEEIMDISNFYLACLWSTAFFLLMMPIAYLSFRFIEAPFLKLRRPYIVQPSSASNRR